MKYQYITQGTCSRLIDIDIEDGIIRSVRFMNGCHGNLQGIGRLVAGMKIEEVIARLDGIRCGHRPTSCPDQLTKALKAIVNGTDEVIAMPSSDL